MTKQMEQVYGAALEAWGIEEVQETLAEGQARELERLAEREEA